MATVLAATLTTVVALAGCGVPPADGGTYKSATQVKNALLESGGICEQWDPHNKIILASSSGSCGKDLIIGVYNDAQNFEQQKSFRKELNLQPLIGKNWIVSGTRAADVQKLIGGELTAK